MPSEAIDLELSFGLPPRALVAAGVRPLSASHPVQVRPSWRRPPHEQAGIVSVRLGTLLLVTSPHAWQTSSAMATSGWIPD
jgi:hypothetical protein